MEKRRERALSGWGQLSQGRISLGFYLYVALASASEQLCGVHKSYNFPQWLFVNATNHENTNRSKWGFTMLYTNNMKQQLPWYSSMIKPKSLDYNFLTGMTRVQLSISSELGKMFTCRNYWGLLAAEVKCLIMSLKGYWINWAFSVSHKTKRWWNSINNL